MSQPRDQSSTRYTYRYAPVPLVDPYQGLGWRDRWWLKVLFWWAGLRMPIRLMKPSEDGTAAVIIAFAPSETHLMSAIQDLVEAMNHAKALAQQIVHASTESRDEKQLNLFH